MNLLRGVLSGIAAVVLLALVLGGPRGPVMQLLQPADIQVVTEAAPPPRLERQTNMRARLEAAVLADLERLVEEERCTSAR